MTITDAVCKKIKRLRRPIWANANAYILLILHEVEGKNYFGPWYYLFDRTCQEVIGEPTPQQILAIADETADYEEYLGPLDVADAG